LSTQTRLSGRIELKGLFSTFTNLEIPRQPREQKALPKQARSGRGLRFDRLTRSLADFAKLVEPFDAHDVSLLALNVLLSFAQFEREVTSERIRDKIAASKRKGIWVGGPLPLGYALKDGELVVVADEAERVRLIFRRYLEVSGINELARDLKAKNICTRARPLRTTGTTRGGIPFGRGPALPSPAQPVLHWRGQLPGRDPAGGTAGDHGQEPV